MDRVQLQQLAELRLEDAEALIASGRWAAAYYLLGYCLECALKACIARQFRTDEVPDRKLVNSFYTHRLDELLLISGAKPRLEMRAENDAGFGENVTNTASGILPWLKTLW
jgi:hypothetical protein